MAMQAMARLLSLLQFLLLLMTCGPMSVASWRWSKHLYSSSNSYRVPSASAINRIIHRDHMRSKRNAMLSSSSSSSSNSNSNNYNSNSIKEITAFAVQHLSLASMMQTYYGVALDYVNPTSFRCVCPFHNDHNPSLMINEAPGYYYCFSCHTTGNVVSLVAHRENITYSQAAQLCSNVVQQKLARSGRYGKVVHDQMTSIESFLFTNCNLRDQRSVMSTAVRQTSNDISEKTNLLNTVEAIPAGTISLSSARSDDIMNVAGQYFMSHLLMSCEAANVRSYLKSRGISLKTAVEFGLGYAPNIRTIDLTKLKRKSANKDETEVSASRVSYSPQELQWFTLNGVSTALWDFVQFKTLTSTLLSAHSYGNITAVSLEEVVASGLTKNNSHHSLNGPLFVDRFRNRLMIPIRSPNGRTIAFGGRVLEGTTFGISSKVAKYINSPTSATFQKKNTLFNMDHAMHASKEAGFVIMVEGYFDVVSLHEVGIKNVVATMGTSVTIGQLLLAANLTSSGTILLLLDGDSAGQSAAIRVGSILQKYAANSPKTISSSCQKTLNLHIGNISVAHDFIKYHNILPKQSDDAMHQVGPLKDCGDILQQYEPVDVVKIVEWIVQSSVPSFSCLVN